MNKNILIGVAAVVIIALGAFVFMSMNKDNANVSPETSNSANDNELANMIESAFTGNDSIKCTYQDENSAGTAYIKGGKVRFESTSTANADYGNVIVNNNIVYIWETGKTEGFMMDITKVADPNDPQVQKYTNPENIRNEVTQNRPSCNKENISDDMFDPPSDVTFSDFSVMMEDIQNQIPSITITLPPGYEYPGN